MLIEGKGSRCTLLIALMSGLELARSSNLLDKSATGRKWPRTAKPLRPTDWEPCT
ncbi:hypothetical protein J4Q44_G00126830 [Coregonus suidteri]|uniref:Uncharacterized protein n=1 Tax=Coregonus suidteri TaxID=861788 RepID=A0AAN8QZX5_9TELE